jgi:hypothetical protein
MAIKAWMSESIFTSRAKDYTNPFRKMMYSSQEEMDAVVGKLNDNTFILQEKASLEQHRRTVESILERFGLSGEQHPAVPVTRE